MSKDKLFGFINCSFAVLGLVLGVLGLVIIVGWLTGFIIVTGESKMELPLGIKVETSNAFFLTILGFSITVISERLTSKIGQVGKAQKQERSTPSTSRRKEGGYSISEKQVMIDLRNRKNVNNLLGHFTSQLSSTERTTRIVFSNPDSLPDEINLRHATSGHGISPIRTPKNCKWQVIKEDSKVLVNPFYSLLTMKIEKFKDLIARKGKMRSYYLTVHKEDLEGYELEYKLKYNNAFVGDEFEWFGEDIIADIDLLTMVICFPNDKPIKSYEVFEKLSAEKEKEPDPILDPDIEKSKDNLSLKWTLQNAIKGHLYLLKWTW